MGVQGAGYSSGETGDQGTGQSPSDVCKMDTHFTSALFSLGESVKVYPSSLVLL